MSRKGIPTKPNKTDKATAADSVFTKNTTAKWIVDYFKPQGSILEPAAGENAFYNLFDNEEKYRCEITDGLDFFEWDKKVDWIITNPPYSIYDHFLQKAFSIANNVVFSFVAKRDVGASGRPKMDRLSGLSLKVTFMEEPDPSTT